MESSDTKGDLDENALFFHQYPVPGKLEIQATKPLGNQRDLALAYSPGVAAPCLAIKDDPNKAALYTARSNLVGVVSNGSAVLGLGNIGPLASKPVMEGKAVLFKKFAGIDVFDVEIDAPDVERMVSTVQALEPTFGGINLEDIKAPECFEVEEQLKARMGIPVFHDDQHGTAIIVAAAVLNGLELAGKHLRDVKIVTSGAGAAALACLNLLVALGADIDNIWITDRHGVAYKGRVEEMDRWKEPYCKDTPMRTLAQVIDGADVFLGLSAAGVLKPHFLEDMAERPLILALANPVPEIMPDKAREARPDAMICTGRSDFPNQVNNVLCFPYMFRGALDCGARAINEEMKLAAVRAIAALAREEVSDVAARAYTGDTPTFGPDFLIPSPFDPRLILRIAPAVAKAAAETGVAARPIEDMDAYVDKLNRFVFRSGLVMKPVFSAAKKASAKRVIFAEGEDERVLRAAQVVLEEGIATPILIGRPQVIETRLARFGLKIRPGTDFELVNPEDDPRYRDYVNELIARTGRQGVTVEAARTLVRTNNTVIACLALARDEADAMICGLEGRFERHLRQVRSIIGLREGVADYSALSMLISQRGVTFFTDTYVTVDPTCDEVAEMTLLAAEEIRRFGIEPKAALLSHSDFGSRDTSTAQKMRKAAEILRRIAPDLEADGEMHGDSALSEVLRRRVYPHSTLTGEANLLVFPHLDSANITLTTVKTMMDALHVGPILLGTAKPAHILTPSVTSRGVVNMTALSVVEASHPARLAAEAAE
ncbi:NADP-dependent malic enzyme [Zhengella mangrovi]|uniref:NADP-dependent malic enzyme n=1 Tax=Zhengella mangrovi TaxID=1982044 RepID=A0A2G1QM93_9HYPH|nr:NADP-dependent malic enzyme [Zhengella mangrovi]PHP66589.1 NADP-dependent malic enzyme [Zhengella mangrovi]